MLEKLLIYFVLSFAFIHAAYASAPVDLNTSSRTHLETVTGIGPGKAQAIIEYRTQHGPFKSVDELEHVSGFGKKTIEKIRSKLTVSQPRQDKSGDGNTVDSRGVWKGTIR